MKPGRETFEALLEAAGTSARFSGDYSLKRVRDVDLHVRTLAKMTDENQHSEVLVYLAEKVLKDRRLTEMAKAVVTLHDGFGEMPDSLNGVRGDVFKMIEKEVRRSKMAPDEIEAILSSL